MALEDMVNCSRCEEPTPESELIRVHAWKLCDNCYDEV